MSTPPHSAFGRRLAVAVVALGTAGALATGCSKDDTKNTADPATSAAGQLTDSNGSPAPGSPGESPAPGASGAPAASTVNEAPAPNNDPNQRPAGAPTGSLEQLLLGSQDAPEFNLTAIPAAQITDGAKTMGGLAQNAAVDPPACQELTRNALVDQSAPNTVAVATGQAAGAVLSVGVTSNPQKLADRSTYMDQCRKMTMKVPFQPGMDATTEATTTDLGVAAPAGVDSFFAARQDSTTTAGGQSQVGGAVTLTGAIRGIGISVTAASLNGPVTKAIEDAALSVFTKQAEKLKNAA